MPDGKFKEFMKERTAIGASLKNEQLKRRIEQLNKQIEAKQQAAKTELETNKTTAQTGEAMARANYYEAQAESQRIANEDAIRARTQQPVPDTAELKRRQELKEAKASFTQNFQGVMVDYDENSNSFRISDKEHAQMRIDKEILTGVDKEGNPIYTTAQKQQAARREYKRILTTEAINMHEGLKNSGVDVDLTTAYEDTKALVDAAAVVVDAERAVEEERPGFLGGRRAYRREEEKYLDDKIIEIARERGISYDFVIGVQSDPDFEKYKGLANYLIEIQK